MRLRQAERDLWDSVGVTPAERMIRLKHSGATVRLQEVGEGSPIVFVHGASNSGTSWASLVCRLEGFRCLLLDRPGCGLSDRLETPFADVEGLTTFSATLVTDVLDALELRSANVIATSYGGYAALRGAAASPERIGRVVIFGWMMGAPMARMPMVMRVASVPRIGRALASVPINERAVRSMFRRIGLRQALEAGRVSDETVRAYLALLRHTDTMRNELDVGRFLMRPIKGLDRGLLFSSSERAAISTPIYFLWGAEDPFAGEQIARDFVEPFPDAELELLPGAGHAVWLDDPDRAVDVTTRFLRSAV
ncbi:MAG: alpha/beta fold hydrolase [Actinomycetota bacterium]